MRIDLQCPFQDKDLAKQRGARWDPQRRVWYVQDIADLSPFAAWLPQSAADAAALPAASPRSAPARAGNTPRPGKAAMTTGPTVLAVASCTCRVLPWEHCDCTRALLPAPGGSSALA